MCGVQQRVRSKTAARRPTEHGGTPKVQISRINSRPTPMPHPPQRITKPPTRREPVDHDETPPPAREVTKTGALLAGGSFLLALVILIGVEMLRH
jgi:hypothetical protein